MNSEIYPIPEELNGATVAAALRHFFEGKSWKEVRTLVESRHVKIGSELCLDSARRLNVGENLEILGHPAPKPAEAAPIVIRFVDQHIVVVEKPAGMNTVRHPSEREWSARRRALSPTLDDLVAKKLARSHSAKTKGSLPRLRVVQRLDKDTSGLLVFARTVEAERGLGSQFHEHTVLRRYLAIILGHLPPQTIETFLIRDRGDGRRGSSPNDKHGKRAVTHVEVIQQFPAHALVACRLETGRTHQIRIHLAERGHPICGDALYNKKMDGSEIIPDCSHAPRLALHAEQLGFIHPVTEREVQWEMPLPDDLHALLLDLRKTTTNPHQKPQKKPRRGGR
ncbi:MAG: RluA family pseudouridine synthase [Gemmataceae bacterium]